MAAPLVTVPDGVARDGGPEVDGPDVTAGRPAPDTAPDTASDTAPTASTAGPRSRSARGARPRRAARPAGAARPVRPLSPTPAYLTVVALAALGALLLAFAGFLLGATRLSAAREQDLLFARTATALGEATVPVSGPVPTGTALGILSIPSLDLEQVFVEGAGSEQTALGPGLRHDSVLPGQAGLSVLVGRRATFGAPFAHLDRLHPGDRIEVTTGQGEAVYVVDLVRTSDAPPSQVRQVASRLTLVTSDPAWAPSRTLTVSAALEGEALPRSTGTTTVAEDAPGEGSSRHLVALLLWSQLLLATAVLLTRLALSMPTRALWIGGVPVVLALLWNVFTQISYLLPNTL